MELLRAYLVRKFFKHDVDEHLLVVVTMLKHDAAIIGAILLAYCTSGWVARPLAVLLRLAAWTMMTASVIDLLVFALFARRLRLNDLLMFGSEGDAVTGMLQAMVGDLRNLPLTLVLLLTLLSLLAVWTRHTGPRQRTTMLGAGLGLTLVGCSLLPDRSTFNNAWVYRNIAEIQLMSGVLKPYGAAQVAAARAWSEAQDRQARCEPGLASQRNVVVVLWESLSAHHSRYLSGLSDWTPQLDALARQHHVWNHFFANGNNTAWGYVATLTGHDPLLAMNARNFQRWLGVADALPFRLKQSGYTTAFMTPGDNGFLEVGRWMKSIGFDQVEGHEAPFYAGMERFNFQAAPDGALYDRSLEWMQQTSGPYFLVLKTVSTHQPFMHPVTRERSERAAFEYADSAFGDYVRKLKAQGYFSRGGVLVVTGDHRDMVPLGPDETDRYGRAAYAMVPLLVIGDKLDLPQTVTAPFQQTDLVPSIEYLVGRRACFAHRQRNLFRPDVPSDGRCVLHMRGDLHDTVDAHCGDLQAAIRLDGDATRLSTGHVPGAAELVDEINAERVGWFLRRQSDGSVQRALPAS